MGIKKFPRVCLVVCLLGFSIPQSVVKDCNWQQTKSNSPSQDCSACNTCTFTNNPWDLAQCITC